MTTLAFDTSTFSTSVAVVEHRDVLAESSVRQRAGHSERLLPLLDEVLARAGRSLSQIERLAVGIGPGSFTGVRLGLATAKGLQLATGIPLVGVSSLAALAAAAWALEGHLVTALDARRDELYAAFFHARAGDREIAQAPLHAPPEHIAARALEVFAHGSITLIGDLDDALYQRLSRVAPARFSRAPGVLATPLARFIAWEADAGRGRLDDGSLEPEYLRGPDAKRPGERAP